MSANTQTHADLDDSWRSLPVIDIPTVTRPDHRELDDSWFDLPVIRDGSTRAEDLELDDPWFI